MEFENQEFEQRQRAEIKQLFESERFKHTVRPYGVEDVLKFRAVVPRVYPANYQSDKLYKLLRDLQSKKQASFTFGALDPVQVSQITIFNLFFFENLGVIRSQINNTDFNSELTYGNR